MAKTLGSAGRYTTNETLRKARQSISASLIVMAVIGLAAGFVFSLAFNKSPWSLVISLLIIVCGYFPFKYSIKRIEEIENSRLSYRKGTAGEAFIGSVLERLSDEYYVINDLSTPYGNLDHVVIGPTGIFVIDTKNWRGVVRADGKGELLLNGKPTDKPETGNFQARIMEIRKRFLSLCTLDDIYFQAVFVFPVAYVEAPWGSTRHVNCMTDEKIVDYIENQRPKAKLNSSFIEKCAHGFKVLASLDKGF